MWLKDSKQMKCVQNDVSHCRIIHGPFVETRRQREIEQEKTVEESTAESGRQEMKLEKKIEL